MLDLENSVYFIVVIFKKGNIISELYTHLGKKNVTRSSINHKLYFMLIIRGEAASINFISIL
jgi:hypothetical protein